MTKRIIAYVRTSKEDQDKRSQIKRIEDWLKEKKWKAQYLLDSGSRDLAESRPQFKHIMSLVTSRAIDIVVVAERDRLGFKDSYEFGYFLHQFRMNGVQLWVCSENKDLAAEDRIEPILASLEADKSKHEQKHLADRTIRGKIAAIQRGEWTGGKPPYGYDLVAKDKHGIQHWRMIYEPGSHRRLVKYPDGTSKRFDGKDSLPGRDNGVYVYPEKSQDEMIIAWVKKIFEWYNQGLGCRAIARQMNDLKVPALYSGIWLSSTIQHLLANPIYYTGIPSWNKKGGGRFLEHIGGNQVPVEKIFGQAKKGRVRGTADYIMADTHNPTNAIIDQATWEAAQARTRAIKETPKSARRPRSKELYFAGILICEACNKPMSAWAQQEGYRCSTNTQYRKACNCNTTKHELIENIVIQHLERTEPGITWLRDNPERCLEMVLASEKSDALISEFTREMTKLWLQAKKAGKSPPEGKPWTFATLRQTQGIDGTLAQKEKEITAKEKERARLVARMGLLDDDGAKIMAQRINEVSSELAALRAAAKPKADRLAALRQTLTAVLEQTRQAREALETNLATAKAEAVRKIIAKIVVRHRPKKHGQQLRSDVVGVTIFPIIGPVVEFGEQDFPDANQRGPVSVRKGSGVARLFEAFYGPEVLEPLLAQRTQGGACASKLTPTYLTRYAGGKDTPSDF